MYIFSSLFAIIWEGSIRTVVIAATILLALAIIIFIVGPLPYARTVFGGPLSVDADYIANNTFEFTSLLMYSVEGTEMIDTGWELEVTSQRLGNVINRYYYGALELNDRYLIVKSLKPIALDNLSYQGGIFPIVDEDLQVVEDFKIQYPELSEHLLPYTLES